MDGYIMENPIEMDDLGCFPPIFGNTQMTLQNNLSFLTWYDLISHRIFAIKARTHRCLKDMMAEFPATGLRGDSILM